MSAQALRVEEQAAPYLITPQLTDHLDTFAGAPESFKRLRELVLNLAVQGRLVPQDPNDEPASELLKRIATGPTGVGVEGKFKRWKRQSPVDDGKQPFGVPHTWAWVRLGEVVQVLDSLRRPVTKNDREPGPYPYYGASGIVDYVSDFLFDEDLVLVGEDGAKWGAGDQTAFAISGKTWVNNHAHVLRPNRTLLSDNYLVQALVALDLQPFITGTTVPKLNQAKLVSIEIPTPPLAEQSRIVAKVEELMALIDRLEAKVSHGETARGKLLDALLTALADSPDAAATAEAWAQLAPHFDLLLQTPADVDRLQQTLLTLAVKGRLVPQDPNDEPAAELLKRIRAEKERLIGVGKIKREKLQAAIAKNEEPFASPSGWEWARFGDVFQVAGGVTLGRKLTGKRTVSHPYLRVANVQRGALDLRQIKEVEIAEEELDRYCLRHEDLLITEGGDWDKVGRTAIWRSEIEPCLHQNHVFRARRITKDMNIEWLALFMNSASAMAYFQESAKQTTNLASINMGELKHCVVPLPPVAEQSRIVTAVASLTALCDRLRERLAARRELSAKLATALTDSAIA